MLIHRLSGVTGIRPRHRGHGFRTPSEKPRVKENPRSARSPKGGCRGGASPGRSLAEIRGNPGVPREGTDRPVRTERAPGKDGGRLRRTPGSRSSERPFFRNPASVSAEFSGTTRTTGSGFPENSEPTGGRRRKREAGFDARRRGVRFPCPRWRGRIPTRNSSPGACGGFLLPERRPTRENARIDEKSPLEGLFAQYAATAKSSGTIGFRPNRGRTFRYSAASRISGGTRPRTCGDLRSRP